ncbi:MAG: alanyl-tRNA editing protein [Caldisericia bacterium]|nr:alanyl-tRNA editing protein [Caldisericia bacterium]
MDEFKFKAKVLETGKKDGKDFVVLDKTYFYPDGKGGQLGDRGKIDDKDVLYVKEENGKIFHFISSQIEKDVVFCEIDKNRRLEISREHTSQHILSRVILNLFNLETVSFHMGEEYSTIDIPYFEFSPTHFEKIEFEVMRIIDEGRGVKKYFVEESEIKKLSIRKEEDIKGKIRIVEIENFDLTMCGGTHVDNTKDILLFKIIKSEKIKGDLLRIYFKSGFRAYKDYQLKDGILKNLSNSFGVGFLEIENFINKLKEEGELNYKKFKSVKSEYINLYINSKDKDFIFDNLNFLNQEDFIFIGKELIKKGALFVFLYNSEVGVIFSSEKLNLNLKDLLIKLIEKFDLKGGGKDFLSIKLNNNGKEIEKFLWEEIKLQ